MGGSLPKSETGVSVPSEVKAMRLPAFAIGILVIALLRPLFGLLRSRYLQKASDSAPLDLGANGPLRYAKWSYGLPALGFVLAWILLVTGDEFAPEAVWMARVGSALCLVLAVFLVYRKITGSVTFIGEKLIYREGRDTWEIENGDIKSFTFDGFNFRVRRKNDNLVTIPATFRFSEYILSHLRRASVNPDGNTG